MKKKVQSILIVGGGSSGWMTGAAIVEQLPHVKVTLVESPDTPTIGVGESTLGHINQYFNFINLKDDDWMKHCNATYKTSIKFTDFKENPKETPYSFHYPFGFYDYTDKPNQIMDWFIYKAYNPETPCNNFAEFYHDAVLMTDMNKMTYNENEAIRNFYPDKDLAYHMNATLFGEYLRDHVCKPKGLTHKYANVTGASKDEDGYISKIHTDSGDLIADLYIDCTGFKSVLIEGEMGVPFEPFNDTLLNDRAIAAPIDYIDKDAEMECVTNCTAIENGWVWNTPLWDRIGTGYVYSSEFVSDDDALQEFQRHLKSNRMICQDDKRVNETDYRFIKIRHGKHKVAWEKNVIAVGLSNGFIEPLESTGLMLTHEAIIKFVTALKVRDCYVNKFDIDSFNFSLNNQTKNFKDFVSAHYALSMRNDTPYWKYITQEMTFCPELFDKNTIFSNEYIQFILNTYDRRYESNVLKGIYYIAAGMGYNPIDAPYEAFTRNKGSDPYYWEKVRDDWEMHRSKVMKIITRLPTHYEFLKRTIYK